jgi:hypothetical protein
MKRQSAVVDVDLISMFRRRKPIGKVLEIYDEQIRAQQSISKQWAYMPYYAFTEQLAAERDQLSRGPRYCILRL